MKTALELTDSLKDKLGDNLQSVVLYGSAAAQDQTKKYSDINVLVVVQDMSLGALKSTMPIVKKWNKAGNPSPLFFTTDRIKQAEDVFPIEFLDIQSSRRVLHGADPFDHLVVPRVNLRHQLEYELRGKLIQLRERYLETDGNRKRIQELLARSISTFSIHFRAVLRLVGEQPPTHKKEIFEILNKHVDIEVEALESIHALREGNKEALKKDPEELLAHLLKAVESVIDFVDRYKETK